MRSVRWLPGWIVAVALAVSGAGCTKAPDANRAVPIASSIRLGLPDEPGQPLQISGIFRDEHGEPVVNRLVRVTQDDASGAFDQLSGTLRTDEYGRFLVRTVFPFTHGGSPGYVNFQAVGRAFPGGPIAVLAISAPDARGTAGNGMRASSGADGVWRVTADVEPGYNGLDNGIPLGRAPLRDQPPGAVRGRAPAAASPPVRTRFTLEDSGGRRAPDPAPH